MWCISLVDQAWDYVKEVAIEDEAPAPPPGIAIVKQDIRIKEFVWASISSKYIKIQYSHKLVKSIIQQQWSNAQSLLSVLPLSVSSTWTEDKEHKEPMGRKGPCGQGIRRKVLRPKGDLKSLNHF